MSKRPLKEVLCEKMIELMAKDERVVMVESDLSRSNGTLEVRSHFPDRVFDCGIAEANMVSVAAGLASQGFIPFTTTFTAFSTRRVCDQITLSVSYAKNPVKLIGTDAGLTGELNGGTHISVEDIAVIRGIPGMVIVDVVDEAQLKQVLEDAVLYDGPMYIRMSRKMVEDVYDDSYEFDLFTADLLKEGKDVTVLASGIELPIAKCAVEELAEEGIDAELIGVHTIKPLDAETVLASVAKTRCAVTCENANVVGGLGSAVAETLVRHDPVPVEMIGIPDRFCEVGLLPWLLEQNHMTKDDIKEAVRKVIARK
ncbi:MAG: transketolase family protein [Lachnospiraceae bacterium]|nr:transketolase family protein [Lachnospiraceae bacterium]